MLVGGWYIPRISPWSLKNLPRPDSRGSAARPETLVAVGGSTLRWQRVRKTSCKWESRRFGDWFTDPPGESSYPKKWSKSFDEVTIALKQPSEFFLHTEGLKVWEALVQSQVGFNGFRRRFRRRLQRRFRRSLFSFFLVSCMCTRHTWMSLEQLCFFWVFLKICFDHLTCSFASMLCFGKICKNKTLRLLGIPPKLISFLRCQYFSEISIKFIKKTILSTPKSFESIHKSMLFLKWHWHDFQVYFEATWSIRKAKWHNPEIWWLTILFHEKEGLFGCYLGVSIIFMSTATAISFWTTLGSPFESQIDPSLVAPRLQSLWPRGVAGLLRGRVFLWIDQWSRGGDSGLQRAAMPKNQGSRIQIRLQGMKVVFFHVFFGKMIDSWGWTAACLCGKSRTAWAPSPSWWMQLVHILG